VVQDRAIVTMADQQKERPSTWFSRSRHYLTLNISQTATDTASTTVTIEGELETAPKLLNGTSFKVTPFSMTLNYP